MINALDWLAVDIIFLVGTLESLEVHYFDSVVLKIKLLLFFQYCHCFHNLEFYKVNTMIVYLFQVCICHPWNGCNVTANDLSGIP